jgi:hypothetical protein
VLRLFAMIGGENMARGDKSNNGEEDSDDPIGTPPMAAENNEDKGNKRAGAARGRKRRTASARKPGRKPAKAGKAARGVKASSGRPKAKAGRKNAGSPKAAAGRPRAGQELGRRKGRGAEGNSRKTRRSENPQCSQDEQARRPEGGRGQEHAS